MPAPASLAALLEQDRRTRIVVRCDGTLHSELQLAAERIGCSANALSKALIRDGLARLASDQPEAA